MYTNRSRLLQGINKVKVVPLHNVGDAFRKFVCLGNEKNIFKINSLVTIKEKQKKQLVLFHCYSKLFFLITRMATM